MDRRAARRRATARAAAPTFAPDGLYLTGVDYDAAWGLPPTRRPVALPSAQRYDFAMRTRVKICGITRARRRPRRGARGRRRDRLRVLGRARRARVDAERARARSRRAAAVRVVVGLFVDPDAGRGARGARRGAARRAAVPRRTSRPEFCRAFGRPYLKAIAGGGSGATEVDLLEYAARYADAAGLLFDAPPAGRPAGRHRADVRLGSRCRRQLPRPLVLSGGLHAGNVGAAIRRGAAVGGRRVERRRGRRTPTARPSRASRIRRGSPHSSRKCAMQMDDLP